MIAHVPLTAPARGVPGPAASLVKGLLPAYLVWHKLGDSRVAPVHGAGSSCAAEAQAWAPEGGFGPQFVRYLQGLLQ